MIEVNVLPLNYMIYFNSLNIFHIKHTDKPAATYEDTCLCFSTMEKGIDLHGAWLITLVHPHNINTPTDYDQIVYKNVCKLVLSQLIPTIHLIKTQATLQTNGHLKSIPSECCSAF